MHCAVCNTHWNITIGATTTISQEKASLVKFPITESFSVIAPDQLCNNWQGRLKPWVHRGVTAPLEPAAILLLQWVQALPFNENKDFTPPHRYFKDNQDLVQMLATQACLGREEGEVREPHLGTRTTLPAGLFLLITVSLGASERSC